LLAVAACILVGFAFQFSFSRKTAIAALEAGSMIFAGVDRRQRIDPIWLAFGLETAIGR